MKTITKYQCEICEQVYESEDAARSCESRPVRESKGVKVGEVVIVTAGEGSGSRALVERVLVASPFLMGEHYAHTEFVDAALIGSLGGNRHLMFDQYRPRGSDDGLR